MVKYCVTDEVLQIKIKLFVNAINVYRNRSVVVVVVVVVVVELVV
jgi:hypothetical protein